jgi:hypothetical protein
LAFETEAVIPLETNLPTLRTSLEASGTNDAALEANLDFLDERRGVAMIHLANYQNTLSRQRNKIMKIRDL